MFIKVVIYRNSLIEGLIYSVYMLSLLAFPIAILAIILSIPYAFVIFIERLLEFTGQQVKQPNRLKVISMLLFFGASLIEFLQLFKALPSSDNPN